MSLGAREEISENASCSATEGDESRVRSLELVERAKKDLNCTAIIDSKGHHTYGDLLQGSSAVASRLLDGVEDLREARVAFMIPPTFDYVQLQWGIWRAGGVAVPLCLSYPIPELAHVLDDAQPSVVVSSPEYEPVLRPLTEERGLRLLGLDELREKRISKLPAVSDVRRAMILYTSGTTGRPKGVVSTHEIIAAQIRSLVEAWDWSRRDRILLTLPLHHLHGILNVLCCALWSGATCEMLPRFDRVRVRQRLASGELTLFMAVPTIYHQIIDSWEEASDSDRQRFTAGCTQLRLMVSGSAALPIPVLERWRQISGHTLLERYGMTEIGMALSNPVSGDRRPGHVGSPLPDVKVCLVDQDGNEVSDGEPGQIQVKGKAVFLEYWNRPDATEEAFTDDGWFRTGDVAIREDDVYRILGRSSVDIIKSGGEKISALEIEEVLLGHEGVSEAAVVGLPDIEWGQRLVAAVVCPESVVTSASDLQQWCRKSLALYKIPKAIYFVEQLPRNSLGKVTKPQLIAMLEAASDRHKRNTEPRM